MKKIQLRRKFGAYLFLLPWLFILLIFTLYPFVEGIRMSLYDFSLREQTFVGSENFRQLFSDDAFWRSMRVTLLMCAIIIPGTLIFSLTVAYAIQDLSRIWKSLFKVVFYLSAIVSQVALVMVWKWMFNPAYGWYKTLCRQLGMVELNLLGDSTYSVPLIGILVLTFTVSQPIVLFSAAIDSIPQSYFEASQLDGAGRFTQFRKVTMPQISNVLLLVTVTTTINNLRTDYRSPIYGNAQRYAIEFDTQFSTTGSTYIAVMLTATYANTATCVEEPLTCRWSPIHSANIPVVKSRKVGHNNRTCIAPRHTETTLYISRVAIHPLCGSLQARADTKTCCPSLLCYGVTKIFDARNELTVLCRNGCNTEQCCQNEDNLFHNFSF
jgi:multiple sugar transport system permease protein